MKNFQVIDGAINCVFDIFQISDEGFDLVFKDGADVAFIEDLEDCSDWKQISTFLSEMWLHRVIKKNANGIDGILFFHLLEKKKYYPSLKDEEAINPNGSRARKKSA